ncbi:hypothetical protein Cgig2_002764 [Carnegiea gigantea]|uniref:Uncharacterized protein n=1 Tax=Carnegiea gigantea TaxID=171969 RepID=A0A9Q1GWQ4_9CARY|nr:hypothetical protein Cgig2_002764 [Carnegiea gigantea]
MKLKLTYKRNWQAWDEKTIIDCQIIIREAETDLQEELESTFDAIEQKNTDKSKFLGENGRGKTIDRIDHQIVIHKVENDLQEELASTGYENHVHTKPSTPTHGPPPAPGPQWPECETLLDNRMLEIIEEDVRATLALPMGPLEVHVASTCEPKRKYTKPLEL